MILHVYAVRALRSGRAHETALHCIFPIFRDGQRHVGPEKFLWGPLGRKARPQCQECRDGHQQSVSLVAVDLTVDLRGVARTGDVALAALAAGKSGVTEPRPRAACRGYMGLN